MSAPPTPRRIFLFSTPRTTSNLFMKIFSTHDALRSMEYPLMFACVAGPESVTVPPTNMDPQIDAEMKERYKNLTFAKAWRLLQEHIATSENENKIPIVKEHCVHLIDPIIQTREESIKKFGIRKPHLTSEYSEPEPLTKVPNPTYLPTSFLLSLTPLFIIRHPIRTVPSYVRASSSFGLSTTDEHFQISSNLRWPRMIFDFYRTNYNHAGVWPVVVDGDDLIADPSGIIDKLSELLGIDAKEAKFEWETSIPVYQPKVMGAFLGSIQKSRGVVKDEKTGKPVSLEEEIPKWEAEFDAETVKDMVKRVNDMIEDYEYLKQFCIKADA